MKPYPVVVLHAAPAADGWNARFSAIRRSYRYRILNRRARPALLLGRVWHIPTPLDAAAMHLAAQLLIGRHDFTSFRATACQANSPLRTLDRLDVARDGDMITVTAQARSFLHHQVRNMVGTLRLVGDGSWPESRVGHALEARDRAAAGPTAPAGGLTLVAVTYPHDPFACAQDAPRPAPPPPPPPPPPAASGRFAAACAVLRQGGRCWPGSVPLVWRSADPDKLYSGYCFFVQAPLQGGSRIDLTKQGTAGT